MSHNEHAEQPSRKVHGRTPADLEFMAIEFAHFNGYKMHPERLAAHLGVSVAAVYGRQRALRESQDA